MEDLDIIRHDMQPGLQPPVDGRAAEPGREPGSGGPRKSASRSSANVGHGLSRSSESPRPGFEARGRAAEYN